MLAQPAPRAPQSPADLEPARAAPRTEEAAAGGDISQTGTYPSLLAFNLWNVVLSALVVWKFGVVTFLFAMFLPDAAGPGAPLTEAAAGGSPCSRPPTSTTSST